VQPDAQVSINGVQTFGSPPTSSALRHTSIGSIVATFDDDNRIVNCFGEAWGVAAATARDGRSSIAAGFSKADETKRLLICASVLARACHGCFRLCADT
jgi:hypothetical protein